jgi:hypothetical protein
MPFNEALAERIRQRLVRRKNVQEKKMFGGVGFLLNGNLLVGVWKDSLCVRLIGSLPLRQPVSVDRERQGREGERMKKIETEEDWLGCTCEVAGWWNCRSSSHSLSWW